MTKMVGRSEEHTSELQSQFRISYAVFCLKKKKKKRQKKRKKKEKKKKKRRRKEEEIEEGKGKTTRE